MEECVFCRIVKGEHRATIVYEDDLVVSFMDIDPISRGHLLIVTREHRGDLDELTSEESRRVMEISKRLLKILKERYNPMGYSIMQNGGDFNDIGHYHMHLFPRYAAGDFGWVSKEVEGHDIEEEGRKIAGGLDRVEREEWR
ncbi:HIT family protein [Propionigenium maris DSM 9537]|uniref:HIT family protein n=1 Tax=Propionigenium maris DSM 9537 TaxID=1123000 RepID=A0A9W6GP88_9FUSO|nr:HIT domain-containing protein [Propionigenium maris]GLI57630.1 HIT family protein [Propionigenium maris DSM 9537]